MEEEKTTLNESVDENEIILSASAVYNFEQCPFAFFESRKYKVQFTTDATDLGKTVHAALCNFYDANNTKDLEDLYNEAWAEGMIADKEQYKLGMEMINNYKENWLGTEGQIVCREYNFKLDYEGLFKIRGIIDRVDMIPLLTTDDEADYEIIDYKTSRIAHTYEELEQNLQLAIYDIALRKLIETNAFGIKLPKPRNVYLSMLYLRHEKMTITHTDEERKELLNFLTLVNKQINSCKKPRPKLNTFCPWCSVKDKCALYNMVTDNIPAYQKSHSINLMTLDELMADYKKTTYLLKIAEDRKDRINTLLKARLENEGKDSITVGNFRTSLISRHYEDYDVKKLREILEPLGIFDDVVRINSKELKKIVNQYGLVDIISATKGKGTTRYYLNVDYLKKDKKGAD